MYPIKFENLYYERIWGGKDLEKFRNNVPEGVIGESWDIACHKNGTGKVENGELKGKTFDEIIQLYGEKLLGNEIDIKEFPLLIKLITAKTNFQFKFIQMMNMQIELRKILERQKLGM